MGLIVGAIARLLVRGPHNLGCIGTSVLGILGSIVGGTLFNALAGNGFELRSTGFLGAIAGAVILLVLARLFGGGGRRAPRRFEDNLDRRR
ncbi:MAG: GlsB/YeaQ/YmgE family stress response membrane protein [Acidimicrobiia bacterium]|nr:GlsB/YeaQ/YmgE family stress response membrane protein [Acidimicrobiia bacterium]